MSHPITVDIWSDIACPWCYIGKRRFEKALATFGSAPDAPTVNVTYHSFELSPDTPVDFEGSEVDFLAAHKGLPAAQVEEMLAQMTELAATEGLVYDFASLRHTNTLLAHELLHFAKEHDLQAECTERLLRAYFTEGRHLGEAAELADLAAEIGLDRAEALAALTDHRHRAAVQADIAQARAFRISGVPFYVIDGRYGVSGAQRPDVFVSALRQAAEES
ncbi:MULTISPECIES: DsbA family protein [unclassified Pseudactinotalea]|uniref:DsbA family oxidoreductase n=1 Tax=unclassified Pseudactinotalea TaxID=2649176 RepID=UPI00128DBCEC|nr:MULTISPECIES: DsbA family oxidoreductase [unclassified Pseudactinotalea]MPV50777.1 thioredoxin domain-containing protein [Pseudactinotalea sp. HY160]QGH70370.1 thioredoxin domain-containing protein [Pseudactinotalea sp. HY158]